MLATRSVAILALNVPKVLERVRQSIEVALFQHCGKSPLELRRHVVKAAIHSSRIGIVADRVTTQATAAVMIARNPVHAIFEDRSMSSFGPRRHHVLPDRAAVTGRASLDADISRAGNVDSQLGCLTAGGRSSGGNRVLPHHVRAQKLPPHDLKRLA